MERRPAFGVVLPGPRPVAELARELGGDPDPGALASNVVRVVAPEHAGDPGDLVVLTAPRLAKHVHDAPGVVLCQRELAPRVPAGRRWIHDHATWVLARLLETAAERVPGTEPARTASVSPGAEVDPSAEVRAGAIVHHDVRIGRDAVVAEGAVLYPRTTLGERVRVGANAVVGRPGFGWATGPSGEVLRIPQLGGVVVEDDAEIGALCTVDAGTLSPTVVERGVKLDAQVHVGHNVRIGEGTIVAAQCGFAGSTHIGRGVLVGGKVGIADHLVIGDGARIAAGSGVISDVPPGAVFAGYPAVARFEWLRAWAKLLGGKKRKRR